MNSGENRTNLIINYLPQTFTDEELYSMFASMGAIKSCKIIRDKMTNYSYGFGFVDMSTPDEAQRAIHSLNGMQIQTKRLKVALARPPGEETKGANLYVSNIPVHYREEDVRGLFASFGNIIQTRVLSDHITGKSKGVGFVLFECKSNAEHALQVMNGTVPEDGSQALTVKFADDNAKKVRPPTQGEYGGFGPGYGPPMRPGGPMRGASGNRSRYNPMSGGGYGGGYQGGYGSPRSRAPGAANAMGDNGQDQYGSGHGQYGSGYSQSQYGSGQSQYGSSQGQYGSSQGQYGSNQGQYASSQAQGESGVTLFAYNIGNDATKQDLYSLFSAYGQVMKVDIIWDNKKNQCKGYGFVTLPTIEDANYAIEYLNGSMYKGLQLQVSLKSDKQ